MQLLNSIVPRALNSEPRKNDVIWETLACDASPTSRLLLEWHINKIMINTSSKTGRS